MQTVEDYNSFGIITVIGENLSGYNHVCKVLGVAVCSRKKSCGVLFVFFLFLQVRTSCGHLKETKRTNLHGTTSG